MVQNLLFKIKKVIFWQNNSGENKNMSNRSGKLEEKLFDSSEIVLLTILGLLFALDLLIAIMSNMAVISHTSNIFAKGMVKSFVFSLVTALCLYLFSYLIKNKRVNLKDWLAIGFYIAIFMLVNVFNIFGLYNYFVLNLFASMLIGLMLAIIGVSVYYNYLKNESNRVKAKAIVVCIFAFVFTIAGAFIIELVKYLVSLIFETGFYSFGKVALNCLYAGVGSIIINIVFYLSLKGDKKIINACLIDVEPAE